jgi:hypothetical protein
MDTAARARILGLTNRFLLKDRCASHNQMFFIPTFPWRGFVLAMRGGDRPNKKEIAISVFGITTKDFSHGHPPWIGKFDPYAD